MLDRLGGRTSGLLHAAAAAAAASASFRRSISLRGVRWRGPRLLPPLPARELPDFWPRASPDASVPARGLLARGLLLPPAPPVANRELLASGLLASGFLARGIPDFWPRARPASSLPARAVLPKENPGFWPRGLPTFWAGRFPNFPRRFPDFWPRGLPAFLEVGLILAWGGILSTVVLGGAVEKPGGSSIGCSGEASPFLSMSLVLLVMLVWMMLA
mmetsp:Transcript_41183/g.101644  ORF Transcript_41183/g.101644 Transcript_41183/m.101644 type:complete len:216 (-) Transcript_41183:288-935(-)